MKAKDYFAQKDRDMTPLCLVWTEHQVVTKAGGRKVTRATTYSEVAYASDVLHRVLNRARKAFGANSPKINRLHDQFQQCLMAAKKDTIQIERTIRNAERKLFTYAIKPMVQRFTLDERDYLIRADGTVARVSGAPSVLIDRPIISVSKDRPVLAKAKPPSWKLQSQGLNKVLSHSAWLSEAPPMDAGAFSPLPAPQVVEESDFTEVFNSLSKKVKQAVRRFKIDINNLPASKPKKMSSAHWGTLQTAFA